MIWQLDLMRCLAATYVVIAHSIIYVNSLPEFHDFDVNYYLKYSGAIGVDLFFVLSGFVISYAWHEHPKSISEFIKGRIARIYPLYFIVALIAIGIAFMKGRSGWEPLDSHRVAVTLFLIPSFDSLGRNFSYVGVGWTLIYEFIFYGLFAAGATVSRKFPEWLAALYFFSSTFYVVTLGHEPEFAVNPIQLEFLYGIILWRAYAHIGLNRLFTRSISVATILICVSYIYLNRWHGFEIKSIESRAFLLGPISASVLAFLLTNSFDKKNFKIGIYIGRISFSLYLTHFVIALPLIGMLTKKFYLVDQNPSAWSFVACTITGIILSMIISVFFHEMLEKPLARFFRNILQS